jgi:hypothetical protein
LGGRETIDPRRSRQGGATGAKGRALRPRLPLCRVTEGA